MNTTIIKEKDEKTVYNIVVDYYNSASAYVAENLFFVFISVMILILIAVITLAMIRSSKHKDSELLKLLEEEEIRAEQELREGLRAFEARKTQAIIYLLIGYAVWFHMGHTYVQIRGDTTDPGKSILSDKDQKVLFFINLLGNDLTENHQPFFIDVQGVAGKSLDTSQQSGQTAITASDFIDTVVDARKGHPEDHKFAIMQLIATFQRGIAHIDGCLGSNKGTIQGEAQKLEKIFGDSSGKSWIIKRDHDGQTALGHRWVTQDPTDNTQDVPMYPSWIHEQADKADGTPGYKTSFKLNIAKYLLSYELGLIHEINKNGTTSEKSKVEDMLGMTSTQFDKFAQGISIKTTKYDSKAPHMHGKNSATPAVNYIGSADDSDKSYVYLTFHMIKDATMQSIGSKYLSGFSTENYGQAGWSKDPKALSKLYDQAGRDVASYTKEDNPKKDKHYVYVDTTTFANLIDIWNAPKKDFSVPNLLEGILHDVVWISFSPAFLVFTTIEHAVNLELYYNPLEMVNGLTEAD